MKNLNTPHYFSYKPKHLFNHHRTSPYIYIYIIQVTESVHKQLHCNSKNIFTWSAHSKTEIIPINLRREKYRIICITYINNNFSFMIYTEISLVGDHFLDFPHQWQFQWTNARWPLMWNEKQSLTTIHFQHLSGLTSKIFFRTSCFDVFYIVL